MPEAKYILAGLGGVACGAVVLGYAAFATGVLSPPAPARVVAPAQVPAAAQPADAQPAAPPAAAPAEVDQNDPRALALAVMRKTGVDTRVERNLPAARAVMLRAFVDAGATPAQATTILDRFVMPDMRQRLPELGLRFLGVMMRDFTVPELRALLSGEDNAANRSARAKNEAFQEHLEAAGQEWGTVVGTEIERRNKAAIKRVAPALVDSAFAEESE